MAWVEPVALIALALSIWNTAILIAHRIVTWRDIRTLIEIIKFLASITPNPKDDVVARKLEELLKRYKIGGD